MLRPLERQRPLHDEKVCRNLSALRDAQAGGDGGIGDEGLQLGGVDEGAGEALGEAVGGLRGGGGEGEGRFEELRVGPGAFGGEEEDEEVPERALR